MTTLVITVKWLRSDTCGTDDAIVPIDRINHAKDFVRTLELDQWCGIIIVSGDGLLHEVCNGLMERPDAEEAIKIPIGLIPGGSGNGLARSICHASG